MPGSVERDAKGKRQDLSDVMHVADKKKTPFFTMVKKGTKPMSTMPEWPVDSYPEPNTEGAVDEQDVKEFENLNGPDAILQSRVQIWERKPKVSRLQELVANQAGIGPKKAFAKSVAKGLVMLARDIETTALGDNESRAGTSTQGNRMRGLGRWSQTAAQTDLAVPDAYRPKAGAIYTGNLSDVVDDTFTTIMQTIYDETGDDDMQLIGFSGSLAKRRASKLTGYAKDEVGYTPIRRYGHDKGDVICQKVDIIETDFGQIILRLSSFINTGGTPKTDASKRRMEIVNMETTSMRFAENPNAEELQNGGGGRRALLQAIGTLEVGNPLFNGALHPSGA